MGDLRRAQSFSSVHQLGSRTVGHEPAKTAAGGLRFVIRNPEPIPKGSPMFKSFKLFVAEQRLRLHSAKFEAYLNQVRQQGADQDYPARLRIATGLLREPEFSRMRSWAEYQRLRNSRQTDKGDPSETAERPSRAGAVCRSDAADRRHQ